MGKTARNERVVAHSQHNRARNEPFGGGNLQVSSVSEQSQVRLGAANNVEVVPADTKSECEIIHQAVDHTLMLEEVDVLIEYVSGRC